MESYYVWIIVGIALLIGEIFTLDFSLSCFGLAAFTAAGASFFGATATVQVLLFSLASLVFFLTVRRFLAGYLKKHASKLKSNNDALIGREAKVTEKIDTAASTGHIKLDGDIWTATASTIIELGADVKVESLDGNVLRVSVLKK